MVLVMMHLIIHYFYFDNTDGEKHDSQDCSNIVVSVKVSPKKQVSNKNC